MSYLPYASAGSASWIVASGGSALVHAGAFALALGGLQQIFEPTEAAEPQTEYTITLDQLDSDALAGIVEQLGQAGADGENLDGVEPTELESLTGEDAEELAALAPDDTLEEATDVDTAEAVSPESLEAEPEAEDITPAPEPETLEAEPDVETLTADTEPETLEETPEPETLEAAPEPETLEALPEVETAEALPEPETLEALPEAESVSPDSVPDTVEQAEAETLTSEDFAALEPTLPPPAVAEALSPIATEQSPLVGESVSGATTATSVAATASVSQAAIPSDLPRESISAAAPTSIGVAANAPPREAVSPTSIAPQTIVAARPLAPQAPAATAAAAARRAPPPPPPSAQDLAVGDLIRRIRTSVADACLLALPRRDGTDGVGLALIASTDQAMSNFVENTLTEDDKDIRQTRTLLDPRQCPAVTYVRKNNDYPATRLGIRLDSSEVRSGLSVTGELRGTAGKYVLLLLIDNNGVVQDLQRFMTFSGNTARFDVPVNRVGRQRDTKHLLLAIATNRPPNVIRDRADRLAQDVFAGLEGDMAEGAALTIVSFDVR